MDTAKIQRILTCPECDRKFDMLNEDDVAEFSFGHDCEA